jgi:hypothetical protein
MHLIDAETGEFFLFQKNVGGAFAEFCACICLRFCSDGNAFWELQEYF